MLAAPSITGLVNLPHALRPDVSPHCASSSRRRRAVATAAFPGPAVQRCSSSIACPQALIKSIALGAAAATLAFQFAAAASADATVTENFATKCIGCHMNGGNVVQAGATLFTQDLQRNGAADFDSIYKLVYAGKGKMPGFGKDCAPRGKCTFGPRLSDDEITSLTDYVLSRAEENWK